MPAFQGLDRAVAPPAATAKKMLEAIDGRWWNVYIGGPESGGHGWSPDLVRQYARNGIDRFMLTYVGRQSRGPLTAAQGQADAREALAIAKRYGYSDGVPLCLDVELPTFNSAPSKTVEYARAWCATVRKGGARPGVYANPAPLMAMAKGNVPADFVWVASWVTTTASPRNPHDVKGMPANLWSRPGQRAWQYAGIIGGRPCNVLGLNVDINVADLGCLAPAPGVRPVVSAGHPARPRGLRRGDRGALVVRFTHRLSVLRSRSAGRSYLDGPRRHFDAETEAALKAFQSAHRLVVDGIYGRDSARTLLKAVRRAKEQRQVAPQVSTGATNGSRPRVEATRLPQLVEEFQRLDAAADRAWQRLEVYGRGRRRLLQVHAQARKAQARPDASLADVTASLGRIEKQLATLVELETREVALAGEPRQTAAVASAVAEPGVVPDGSEVTGSTGPTVNGSNGASSQPHPTRRSLAELPDVDLDNRLDVLDRRLDKSRRARIARYARADQALAKLPGVEVVPAGQKPAGAGSSGKRPASGKKPEQAGTPGKRPAHPVSPGKGPAQAGTPGKKPAQAGNNGKKPTAVAQLKPGMVANDAVRALQRSLNRFTERYLEGVPPLEVDGKKGPQTNKRVRTAKYYLGYGDEERRSSKVKPAFLRRLRRPRSPRCSGPAMLARAEGRRRKHRQAARRPFSGPIEGTPKHIVDAIALPIARSCRINRSTAENDAANARHGSTVTGGRSDHQGPPTVAWAADISNGGSPTPEMDRLARRLARRFGIDWHGSGLVNATHSGYRFQLIYRTYVGGNHFNHVHFGVRDV
jgi:peptidoglycan hydrolase-like protein with peptidoglycan-binding domain